MHTAIILINAPDNGAQLLAALIVGVILFAIATPFVLRYMRSDD